MDPARPLAALVELLEGTHLAPPERLPHVVAVAGRAIGVDIVTYLIDYEQRHLHAVPPDPRRPALGVDATLAGRAFQLVRIQASHADGRSRLWVPLLDGVERLGVLEVCPLEPVDLDDPVLRRQCEWLAKLIGHLVTVVSQYGDTLDAVRVRQRRNAATDLLWRMLPPLTSGVDGFVLAGLLEPCYNVGGDAFDYSLSETRAQLAIFDAVGHNLSSGLIAAVALSAYRGVRRDGAGLVEQAAVIDETIAGQFGSGDFVTGVLAELDLRTGRMTYVNAGHPHVLYIRGGKVISPRRPELRRPFGLGRTQTPVAEETLEPGDWLVLYTDGIVEAFDHERRQFGLDRLIDFLHREVAAEHPPPETARRLIHAVLGHQRGVLQDDATVLLARWA